MLYIRHITWLLLACSLHTAQADNPRFSVANAENGAMVADSRSEQIDARQQKELETRTQNIDALLSAYLNIASESRQQEQKTRMQEQVLAGKAQARLFYQARDYKTGRSILEHTYAKLQTAIIQLRDGSTLLKSREAGEQYDIRTGDPARISDRKKLAHSMDALLDAYQRVAREKGRSEQAATLQEKIDTIRIRADEYFKSGDSSAGSELLKGGYGLIREALAALREGETLIHSLDFATPQEEYQYYVEKTQSQQMAIKMLLDLNTGNTKNSLLNGLLSAVQQMLEQAAVLAAENNFSAAIALMDKAFSRLQSGLMMSLSAP